MNSRRSLPRWRPARAASLPLQLAVRFLARENFRAICNRLHPFRPFFLWSAGSFVVRVTISGTKNTH